MFKREIDELCKVSEIMKILNTTRRIIEYAIERLGLEPTKWVSGVRYYNEKQVREIKEKVESSKHNTKKIQTN